MVHVSAVRSRRETNDYAHRFEGAENETLLLVRRRARLAPMIVDKRGLAILLGVDGTRTPAEGRVPRLSGMLRVESALRRRRSRAQKTLAIATLLVLVAACFATYAFHQAYVTTMVDGAATVLAAFVQGL